MAKLGEGDARWIVSERKDGTNVHNWHWSEKDVLPWAKKRLTELIGGLKLTGSSSSLEASSSADVSVTGEAIINNRKNKLIPSYELELKGQWLGKLKTSEGQTVDVNGQWKIPYLAEENADEDPEVQFTTASESDPNRQSKASLQSEGKKVLLEKIRQFVREIQAGRPANNPAQGASEEENRPEIAKLEIEPPKTVEAPKREEKRSSGRIGKKRTYRATEKFYARAQDIYDCFTNQGRISAYTQSPAQVEPKVGGKFNIFGGSVVGEFTELKPSSEIKLDWRFQNWQDADVSQVHIKLEEPQEGTTILTLEHRGIPDEDKFENSDVLETTMGGWKQQIFHKIRAVFGYGLGL